MTRYNSLGEKVSRARYREMLNAAKNRRELIAAGLYGRRELAKMGSSRPAGCYYPRSALAPVPAHLLR